MMVVSKVEALSTIISTKGSKMKPYNTSFVPYIGITDFMTREQTLEMLSYFESLPRQNIPHKLMVGVMMSYTTLHKMETKWATAFPTNGQISNIFVRHPLAFNTLHYADYRGTDVFNSLGQAIAHGGIDVDALQLDMIWPKPGDVANAVHASIKCMSVILQVGKGALAQANDDPMEMIERLRDYGDVIDGVLLDKSMGQGLTMDARVLLKFVEAVYTHLPTLRVAVAGGLGPYTTGAAELLVSYFPDISIDAQGRLRASGSMLDPIDWELAKKYLREAVRLYVSHTPA